MLKTSARSVAFEVVSAILRRQKTLDPAINQIYRSTLGDADKAFARQLVMQLLRHHGAFQHILRQMITRPLAPKLQPVEWIIELGMAQLLCLSTPAHAAIHTSVALCKEAGFEHQAAMVNAVLRNLSRAEADPLAEAMAHCLPEMWKMRWQKQYGAQTVADIADSYRQEPPLDVWVRDNPEGWAVRLDGTLLLEQTVRCRNGDVSQWPGYDEGAWWVQDVAASLAVQALGAVSGRCVYDLGAAPGGKTAQLAAAGANVVAVDRSLSRMRRLEDNLTRLALHATSVIADLNIWDPNATDLPRPDAVLLDAPCSATGTIRKNPDILWQKSAADIDEMVAVQRGILQQISQWMPAHIPLVYATCSLEAAEGEEQIDWLLQQDSRWRVEPLDAVLLGWPADWITPRGFARTLPCHWADRGGMDGFFIARLVCGE